MKIITKRLIVVIGLTMLLPFALFAFPFLAVWFVITGEDLSHRKSP